MRGKRDSQLNPVAAFDLICVIYILPLFFAERARNRIASDRQRGERGKITEGSGSESRSTIHHRIAGELISPHADGGLDRFNDQGWLMRIFGRLGQKETRPSAVSYAVSVKNCLSLNLEGE